jgi:catechol 2,3-dioxygenase-like lactoylglutathione lyase family enzyme
MILGIDVAFIHTPHRALADWYADVLGLPVGYGDDGWQSFEVTEGSRFAIDLTGFPRSAVDKQAIVLSFKVDDIRQEVKTLAARGVRFYPSADEAIFDAGPSLVATFIDPDGNWMQLSQRNAIAEGK